ncbi:hypothetical protein H4O18_17670 [Arenibacter sp. BSSL-BM3]|uniref:Transposase n=1 Tax=Arenibacter arenosicollis TaxID=2762274 RepID=A0ABR7QSB5_9FLAO|nr:hypothetical protein [Arenibacter arenosicollis]MBC8769832.1 hypothetical protein [Arenibacter arenosicollis]
MPPKPYLFFKYVDKLFSGHQVNVVYEAGCCGYHAHRCFEGYGWRSQVVYPADVHRKGRELHTKTDKIDAQLLSRELKDGRLERIHVSGNEREQLRSLFRWHNDPVKDYRRIKSYIRMQYQGASGVRQRPLEPQVSEVVEQYGFCISYGEGALGEQDAFFPFRGSRTALRFHPTQEIL